MWLAAAGAAVKFIGGIADANNQAGQLKAESAAEKQNAINLTAESQAVGASGARREEQARREYRSFAGEQFASISESNLGTDGSALDVARDSEAQGYLDALNIRYAAQEESRSIRNSARQATYRSKIASSMAKRAKAAGYLGALGGALSDGAAIKKTYGK